MLQRVNVMLKCIKSLTPHVRFNPASVPLVRTFCKRKSTKATLSGFDAEVNIIETDLTDSTSDSHHLENWKMTLDLIALVVPWAAELAQMAEMTF